MCLLFLDGPCVVELDEPPKAPLGLVPWVANDCIGKLSGRGVGENHLKIRQQCWLSARSLR